jgi:acyl-CoA reductase-like NAD-dependent aldehyde dehydrogenase
MQVNEMPHGGLTASGYGKDLSMYALEDYTVARGRRTGDIIARAALHEMFRSDAGTI